MIKKIILLTLIITLVNTSILGIENKKYNLDSNIKPKEEMRTLISGIRERGGDKRIIIANGGLSLYYDNNQVNEKFLNIVDGLLVESVIYGYDGYNKKTPKKEQILFLNLLLPLKQRGKEIILLEYVNSKKGKIEVKKLLEKNDFKGETPSSMSLNKIYLPINKESGKDIEGLKDSNNILVLLNYEKFKTVDGLIKTLSSSEFDFLIIDPFFGDKMLNKEQVERIRTRADGTKRKVVAYFSIGEAEGYRPYWDSKWKIGNPSWIVQENENWKDNFIVEFWSPKWKEIIKNFQNKIDNSNFDGYFLDTIDTYERFED